MRPVMMESLTSDTEAYRACLASILQMELDEFPTFEGLSAVLQWDAWLASELNLCCLRFGVDAITVPHGLWVARLASPYPGYEWHSVVCAGGNMVHDPHPEPQEYELRAVMYAVELLLPMDPGEPFGRFIDR